MWVEEILWDKKYGMDVYRCKGVLTVSNSDQLHTLQVMLPFALLKAGLRVLLHVRFNFSVQLKKRVLVHLLCSVEYLIRCTCVETIDRSFQYFDRLLGKYMKLFRRANGERKKTKSTK